MAPFPASLTRGSRIVCVQCQGRATSGIMAPSGGTGAPGAIETVEKPLAFATPSPSILEKRAVWYRWLQTCSLGDGRESGKRRESTCPDGQPACEIPAREPRCVTRSCLCLVFVHDIPLAFFLVASKRLPLQTGTIRRGWRNHLFQFNSNLASRTVERSLSFSSFYKKGIII